MGKKETLQYWLDQTWGKQNLKAFEEVVHPDAKISGVMAVHPMPISEIKEIVPAFCNLVGPISISIPLFLEDGNWISARVEVQTSRLDTRETFKVADHMMIRFDGDKVAEIISHMDYLTFFEKIGLLPTETIAACLAGQRLDWA